MSDFVQTMKDWRRMCNYVPGKSESKSLCSDKESGYVCPLKDNGLCCKAIASQTDKDIISGENIIAAWAAEHPEPVYELWGEWFEKRGDLIRGWHNATNIQWIAKTFGRLMCTPIPADIAEKLGIEPKEG